MIKEVILKMTGQYQTMYDLKRTNERYEQDLYSANRRYEQLQEHLEAQKENSKKNYTARCEMEQKVKEVTGQRDKWVSDYNTIANRCTELEDDNEKLTAKCNDQYVQIAKLNNEKAELETNDSLLISKNAELEQKLQQFKIDNDQLLKDNNELSERVNYYKAKANHKKVPVTTTPTKEEKSKKSATKSKVNAKA